LNVPQDRKISEEKERVVDTSWDLFKPVFNLGEGAFGEVMVVECLESTRLNKMGNGRVIMNQSSLKKANLAKARVNGQKGVI